MGSTRPDTIGRYKIVEHAAALSLLERFTPAHSLVTAALADLRVEMQEIERRRLEAERRRAEEERRRRERQAQEEEERRQAAEAARQRLEEEARRLAIEAQEKARVQFRLAVSAQRNYQLSPRVVSPRILALFEQVR
jgi:hypothetical protein